MCVIRTEREREREKTTLVLFVHRPSMMINKTLGFDSAISLDFNRNTNTKKNAF